MVVLLRCLIFVIANNTIPIRAYSKCSLYCAPMSRFFLSGRPVVLADDSDRNVSHRVDLALWDNMHSTVIGTYLHTSCLWLFNELERETEEGPPVPVPSGKKHIQNCYEIMQFDFIAMNGHSIDVFACERICSGLAVVLMGVGWRQPGYLVCLI